MIFLEGPMIWPFIIIGGVLIFAIIGALTRTAQNAETKGKYKGFEDNIYMLQKGMSKGEVIKTLGLSPDTETTYKLYYRKKLLGLRDLGDHETTEYVFYFDENGHYIAYDQNYSYRKTT